MITSIHKNERSAFPHYELRGSNKIKVMHHYLQVMFMPLIKKHFPQHYLIKSKSRHFQDYLACQYQTHRYFIRFDIDRLYLKVTNYSIGPILLRNFEDLYGFAAPNHMYQHLESGSDLWFNEKPWSTALPHERDFLCLSVGVYLLGLCMSLARWPFLCYHHEFVVLFRSKAEIDECLDQVRLELKSLKLAIDEDTICSGEIYPRGFKFMGFEFPRTDN